MWTLSFSLCVFFVCYTSGAHNRIQYGNFENGNYSNKWHCNGGCIVQQSGDSFSGHKSLKTSNRHHDWEGPSQNVQVSAQLHYNFTGYVKLMNTATGHLTHSAEAMMGCKDTSGKSQYFSFGVSPYIQTNVWTEVGGVHKIPYGYHDCFVYFQIKGSSVNYLLDQVTLEMVPNNPNWRTKAQSRIEQIRKADITITLSRNSHLPANTYIELKQTKHEFAFGSVVGASQIVDPAYKKYQDFFYDNFEWGVLENALKWRPMESHRDHINYNKPLTAINALRQKGIKVRGHNVFWAVDKWIQDWVKALSGQNLLSAMSARIKGVIGHTKGLLEHWDVNNENLHGDFYERHTGNPNITMKMFRDVHTADHNAKLFLNDYAILTADYDGNLATALKEQARMFKDANVPIYGVGIQSHIYNAHLDITLLKSRLDKVAEAGLPIWITELTLSENDENLKAAGLTDLLTLYFSHPAVEGVLLWGFWDQILWLDASKLAEGPNVTANAAGRAYQKLFHETWRTHVTHKLTNHHPVHVRGFKGEYTVNVKQNGHVIQSEQFTLGSKGVSLELHLPQSGGQSASIIVG